MTMGFVMLAVGVLLSSWFRINLEKPKHNIPFAFRRPLFVIIGSVVWISLTLAGIVLIFSSSLSTGIWVLIILAALWFFFSKLGSPEQSAKVMKFSYQAMRSKYPKESEQEILFRVLKARYPAWDNERIQMLVGDCGSIDYLIKIVIYYESGK